MALGTDSVKQAKEAQGDRYERFDDSGLPYVKMSPSVAPVGDVVALRYFTGAEENGGLSRGYLGIVLDNPSFLTLSEEEAGNPKGTEGTKIIEADSHAEAVEEGYATAREWVRDGGHGGTTDYKIVNEDDKDTKVGDMGATVGGNMFEGSPVDEIAEDRIVLIVTGATSRNVARTLDVKGAVAADMAPAESDSITNGGLIEYAPHGAEDDKDGSTAPRYARDPELREDLEGKTIGLLLQRRSEIDEEYAEKVESGERYDMYWSTAFTVPEDGAPTAEDILKPTDEFEPTWGNRLWLEWNYTPRADGEPTTDSGLSTEETDEIAAFADSLKSQNQDIEALAESGGLAKLVEANFDGDVDDIVAQVVKHA